MIYNKNNHKLGGKSLLPLYFWIMTSLSLVLLYTLGLDYRNPNTFIKVFFININISR